MGPRKLTTNGRHDVLRGMVEYKVGWSQWLHRVFTNLCGCTHMLCHLWMAASTVARCGYERCPQLARVKPKAIQSHAQDKATRQFKSVLQTSSAERSEELRFLWTKSSSPRWGSRVERWKPPTWGRRVQPETRKHETLGNVVDSTQ